MQYRILLLLFAFSTLLQAQTPVYLDPSKDIEARVEDALSRMTLAEKIDVIHAQSKFSSAGVKRLGFPDFWTDSASPTSGPTTALMACAPTCFGTNGNKPDRPTTRAWHSLP